MSQPEERPKGDPWHAFGYVVAGVAFYGLLGWLDRMRTTRLYRYELDARQFSPWRQASPWPTSGGSSA